MDAKKREFDVDIEEVVARECIRDALSRYCRGIDRCDENLIAGVFHAGSTCDYGKLQIDGKGLARFIKERQPAGVVGQHHITHSVIVFGDRSEARVESYFIVWRATPGEAGAGSLVRFGGRYLDRFTLKNGKWRISDRVVVQDWFAEPEALGVDRAGYKAGSEGPADPSYAFFGEAIGVA